MGARFSAFYKCTSGKTAMDDLKNEPNTVESLLSKYKEHVKQTRLADELYKWKLIQKFHGRPNIDAPDFAAEIAGIDYSNLIYPMATAVIKDIAAEQPERY